MKLQEDYFIRLRDYFQANFIQPSSPSQVTEDISNALENPVFKQHIFANNLVAVLDHSSFTYRYLSPHSDRFFDIDYATLLEKGPNLTFGLVFPEDLQALQNVFEEATRLISSLPLEHRLHFRLNYSCRLKTSKGNIRVYQQTIPLALNDAGYPYLVLGVLSDISEFGLTLGINYKATLNIPGRPLEVKMVKESHELSTLTAREKEVVLCLAEGDDSNEIAKKLFISEGTVRKHRENILQKTGARNAVHLMKMAVANGWV